MGASCRRIGTAARLLRRRDTRGEDGRCDVAGDTDKSDVEVIVADRFRVAEEGGMFVAEEGMGL
jgi:hypothetical protein